MEADEERAPLVPFRVNLDQYLLLAFNVLLLSLLEDMLFLAHLDGELAPGGDFTRQENRRKRPFADKFAKNIVMWRLLPSLHR